MAHVMPHVKQPAQLGGPTAEAKQFRLIFMASFLIFLMVVIVARCLPPRWRPFPPGPAGHRPILEEARAAANTVLPFAFMG